MKRRSTSTPQRPTRARQRAFSELVDKKVLPKQDEDPRFVKGLHAWLAYLPAPKLTHRGKGRPRLYGEKVRLKDMATDDRAFTSAPSPVYGKRDVMVRFRVLDLL